ncbi:oligosaccharyltransferase complex subunit epsilon [Paragonimus westermani]|uniref:Dolichyl-diphosphooligosaccharide--protein glycosyltransferase subunit DAD1 n=1 Tax=Paragonimus westermani TaxID=34504 RepID=A0A5J4NXY8_9TREM|nr:oligosaccharyltransferase complex subunit epsilon [Paragonimus westermani]
MGGHKGTSSKTPDTRAVTTKPPKESISIGAILKDFFHTYKTTTPKRLQILDIYLSYVLLTGIVQFIYCCIVGTFPFNAFLSGFISCVASFVLGVCLRMHSNPQNKHVFLPFCPESAYGDFIFAHVILHLVVFNFMG